MDKIVAEIRLADLTRAGGGVGGGFMNHVGTRRSASAPVGGAPARALTLPALVLAVVAAGASVLCSVIAGLNLGPVQARLASNDALPGDQTTALVLVGLLLSNVLWTLLGITGLVLGILAAKRGTGTDRRRGIAAIIVSAAAPVVSFSIWLTLTLLTSPLG